MTAEIDLCNLALSAIGTRSTVAAFTENSVEAEQCALHYPNVRDELLRVHPWNFARRQAALAVFKAAIGTPENPLGAMAQPPLPWAYAYGYPGDCLRARLILPLIDVAPNGAAVVGTPWYGAPWLGPAVRFVESSDLDGAGAPVKVILTNQQNALAVYTTSQVVEADWDGIAAEVLRRALEGGAP